MKTKRHTVEQIIAKLRQAEVELGKGLSLPTATPADGWAECGRGDVDRGGETVRVFLGAGIFVYKVTGSARTRRSPIPARG